MMSNNHDKIKGLAALRIHLGKMDGAVFEKKITRYNDIAGMVDLYLNIGGNVNESAAINEVIEYSVIGSDMHIPRVSLASTLEQYEWMRA